MTLGALVVGVAALVFAVGLDLSLRTVAEDLDRDLASPIRVELGDRSYPPAQVTAAIANDSDTGRYVSMAQRERRVPGRRPGAIRRVPGGRVLDRLYARSRGAGSVDRVRPFAPTNFFTETGLHVGDR